jgi:hypothetical protein
MATTLG